MQRRYYIAVNIYRSSTDHGPDNTWRVRECATQRDQRRILRDGLPVNDSCWVDSDGVRHATVSTMGIRPATRAEIREADRSGSLKYADLLQSA